MNNIKTFEQYTNQKSLNLLEEVRLEDILKTNDPYINSFKKNKFDDSDKLIENIDLKENGSILNFKIFYNHSSNHDLIKRIKERTSLKSISEFNILFKRGLIEFFNNNETDKSSYTLYYIEYNFSIIIHLKKDIKFIKLATILPNLKKDGTSETIYLNSKL